jgi:hypothetical protein
VVHSTEGADHRTRYAALVEINFGLLVAIVSHHLFKYDAPEALAYGCCDGWTTALFPTKVQFVCRLINVPRDANMTPCVR